MGGFYEMELNYIDIGCNLMGKQFKDDREQVVEQSLADGVGLIITGTDPSSNRITWPAAAGDSSGIPVECIRITRTVGIGKDVRSWSV